MFFWALPTHRGILLLLLAASSTAVAFVNSGLITAFTAASLDAIVLSGFVMVLFSCTGMKLARSVEDGICGEMLSVTFSLENRFFLFRQSCVILEKYPFVFSEKYAFASPALAPKEKCTFTVQIKAEKRGSFFLDKIYLVTGDPLGLFSKKKCFHQPVHIEIFPRDLAPDSLEAADKRGGIPDAEGRPLGHAGKGMEFFGVRPYRIGDEIRHIHWKSTATKGKLMVKEFEASAVDQIVILLDTDEKKISPEPCDNNLEFLIACANSINEFLSRKYCHLRFFSADGKDGLYHISGDASSVREKIRQALTLLRPSDTAFSTILAEAVENIPQRSIVYLLSMSEEKLAEYTGILAEQDCFCNLIYAPARNFPLIEPDKPRIVRRDKMPEKISELAEIARMADFTSGAEILEHR